MNAYNITKENYSKIEYTIEKLYQHKDRLIGKTITWDDFTTDLLKFELPYDKLSKITWREYRPRWVTMVNEGFLQRQYPCQLIIKYNKGVELSVDGAAVREKITFRFDKLVNNIETNKKTAENMVDTFPEAKKILMRVSHMQGDLIFTLGGMIDSSKQIPLELKRQLRAIVQKHYPSFEE
jgi:hypothetical protein